MIESVIEFANYLILQVQTVVSDLHVTVAKAVNGETMIAAAIVASILGGVAYTARRLPMRIWLFVKRHIVFSYIIEYDRMRSGTMLREIAERFEVELQKRVSNQRASARLTTFRGRLVESLSNGKFFFYHEGCLIHASRAKQSNKKGGAADQEANAREVIELRLTSLRYNRSKMLGILQESAKSFTLPGVYQLEPAAFNSEPPRAIRCRNLVNAPVLSLDSDVKKIVDSSIDNFLRNRDYRVAQGLPSKLVFMLHGEPGTGKSALSEYIAHRLKTSLFVVNALSTGNYREVNIADAVSTARDNIALGEVPVVLADDFDTYWKGLRTRTKKAEKTDPRKESYEEGEAHPVLGKMLAVLQSPVEVSDCVVIFTTNHLKKIDSAMYRPGRVDVLIELGRMKPESIMDLYTKVYGKEWPEGVTVDTMRACDVSSYKDKAIDGDDFIRMVTNHVIADDELFNQNKEEIEEEVSNGGEDE